MAAGVHHPSATRVRPGQPGDPIVVFYSAPDGTWRYTTSEPRDEPWMQPDFDDSDWEAMVARPLVSTSKAGRRYLLDRLEQVGAEALGIDEGTSLIWLRRRFVMSPNWPAKAHRLRTGMLRKDQKGEAMPRQNMAARPPLVLIHQHFGGTVFDRRTSRYLPFDRDATDLLMRLGPADRFRDGRTRGRAGPGRLGLLQTVPPNRLLHDRGILRRDRAR